MSITYDLVRECMDTKESVTRNEISTAEASRVSGLSINHVTHLLRKGQLEGRRFGNRVWIVYADSLEHYVATPHKSGPKGPRSHKKFIHQEQQNIVSSKNGEEA